jgi:hypothetical protein
MQLASFRGSLAPNHLPQPAPALAAHRIFTTCMYYHCRHVNTMECSICWGTAASPDHESADFPKTAPAGHENSGRILVVEDAGRAELRAPMASAQTLYGPSPSDHHRAGAPLHPPTTFLSHRRMESTRATLVKAHFLLRGGVIRASHSRSSMRWRPVPPLTTREVTPGQLSGLWWPLPHVARIRDPWRGCLSLLRFRP